MCSTLPASKPMGLQKNSPYHELNFQGVVMNDTLMTFRSQISIVRPKMETRCLCTVYISTTYVVERELPSIEMVVMHCVTSCKKIVAICIDFSQRSCLINPFFTVRAFNASVQVFWKSWSWNRQNVQLVLMSRPITDPSTCMCFFGVLPLVLIFFAATTRYRYSGYSDYLGLNTSPDFGSGPFGHTRFPTATNFR